MDKYLIDKAGDADEYLQDARKPKHIPFPLCLAIKYGNDVPEECPNFMLNISRGEAFIETDLSIPAGSKLLLHFYIPPESKLLSEFRAIVEKTMYPQKSFYSGKRENLPHVKGLLVKILDHTHHDLKKLEDYLEEKRHLIDEEV